jgi:hypothetical protein
MFGRSLSWSDLELLISRSRPLRDLENHMRIGHIRNRDEIWKAHLFLAMMRESVQILKGETAANFDNASQQIRPTERRRIP